MAHKVEWIDGRKQPQCPPNPAYPNGIDIDVSAGAGQTCTIALPYPAKRIGAYLIECPLCGLRTMLTTAGRTDDPKSVKVACMIKSNVN